MRAFLLSRLAAVVGVAVLAAGPAWGAVKWIEPTAAELAMKAEPKAPGAPAIVLSYDEEDDADSAEVTVHVRIKVLTQGGLDAGTVEVPERIVSTDEFGQQFQARVIHADGSVVMFTGTPQNTTAEKSNGNRKTISLPSVQVGSILEYAYHFASQNTLLSQLSGFYAPIWRVQQPYFVKAAHFTLRTPMNLEPQMTRWVANLPGSAAPVRVKDRINLDLTDIASSPDEEFMPPRAAVLYRVKFFYYDKSNDKYWGESGDRVDEIWSPYYAPRKPIQAVANGLLLPGDNDQEKLRKLYAAVEKLENTDFTRARSRREEKASGVHEVHNSEDVWNRKRGDSYELTLLFVAFARAAGYKAYPMAVASRDEGVFDQSILTWSQMDSLVAIVNVGGRDIFFDPGSRLCPFAQLTPEHSNVKGVEPEDKLIKFRVTPALGSGASRTERKAELTVAPNGTVKGMMKISWLGTAGLPMRQEALREDAHATEVAVEKRVQGMMPSGVEVKLTTLTGLADGDAPLEGTFSVSGTLGMATSKRLVLPAQFFVSTSKSMLPSDARTQPVAFPEAHVVRDTVFLHVPPGLGVETMPEARKAEMGGDVSYVSAFQPAAQDPHVLVMQRTFVMGRVDYKQDEYAKLHKYFAEVAGFDQDQLVLSTAKASGNPVIQ